MSSNETQLTTVTVLYYDIHTLEFNYQVGQFPQAEKGRVIIDDEFKRDKSIIAVCRGEVKILNKIGDRINE
ncbi:TIGR02922 family protein [Thalassotalea sp. PS06]|uniref:TIGR02922 family protein n=1 Tax=Thalassotalea sp. PS06 TaxID=2594005 RepID=UPI0011650278|nr:TIGR02922 family protein [Thalassotalea sp. PS06]QDP01115.1 TIGR02922 family protein [Thalassotalea sp. PS06]